MLAHTKKGLLINNILLYIDYSDEQIKIVLMELDL